MPDPTIQLLHPPDGATFLGQTREFLLADEIANNVILGRAEDAAAHPEPVRRDLAFTAATAGGTVCGAAMCADDRPGRDVVVSRMSAECAAAIANEFAGAGLLVTGVVGVRPAVDGFAAAYSRAANVAARTSMEFRIYRLDATTGEWAARGRFRAATVGEFDELQLWCERFQTELGFGAPSSAATARFRRLIDEARVFVWDDGGPATMAAWIPATPHTGRVVWVYTPPSLRGRGYATACVAALSRRVLAAGRVCTLNADAANPTSNGIYQKIGYRAFGDSAEYRFDLAKTR